VLGQSRRDLILVTVLLFLVGGIGIAAAITLMHYHSTRRTLEEVKGLARNILESIPTGVLTTNREGLITAANPAAESILMRSLSALLGHSYASVFADGGTIRKVLDEALQHHRYVIHKDLAYDSGEHPSRTIRVSTAELTGDDGHCAGVILQAQNVTEWLALEQRVRVAEKLSALHTLSAGVAHELRNPLSAIDLNLHLLEEEIRDHGVSTPESVRYLQVVNAECRRLAGILDNFMKFARPGAVSLHRVESATLFGHLLALLQAEADERKIRIVQTIEDGLPAVLGDETQISQVLVNVMVNAFHAMPDGGMCWIAATQRLIEEKRWVEISVKDTGVGIGKDNLSRLFEPFYTTKPTGSGLGLAIAYRIIQDHGGTIQVSSMPGGGTTVAIKFPVACAERQTEEVQA
jgi:signal transduction histidine kinase